MRKYKGSNDEATVQQTVAIGKKYRVKNGDIVCKPESIGGSKPLILSLILKSSDDFLCSKLNNGFFSCTSEITTVCKPHQFKLS